VRLLFLTLLIALTSGCEIWYDSRHQQGDLRVHMAASPQAELSAAYLSIARVEVQHVAGQWHQVPLDESTQEINWQSTPLEHPVRLARGEKLPEGHYHAIRIFFNRTEGTAERHNDGAQFALYTSDVYKAELDEPLRVDGQHSSEILVWLDLQRSLRFNSDTNESYYRLYSPGIYAYSQNAGHIHGTITTQRWANLNCPTPQYGKHNQLFGAYAYIYRNQQQNLNQLLDLQPSEQAPIMSSPVYQHSNGEFYYRTPPLPSGHYIVALTCNGLADNPLSDDRATVRISTGITVRLNSNTGFTINF